MEKRLINKLIRYLYTNKNYYGNTRFIQKPKTNYG